MSDPDCLFCKIVAGEMPATRVYEDERTIAFMDINPGTRGHLLVIPREHAKDLLEIDPEDLAACAKAAQTMAARVTDRLDADGVNLINSCGAQAWQTVFHFHMHVIPRYAAIRCGCPGTPRRGTATRSRPPRSGSPRRHLHASSGSSPVAPAPSPCIASPSLGPDAPAGRNECGV